VTQENHHTLGGPPLDDPRIIGAPIIAFYVIIVVGKTLMRRENFIERGLLQRSFFFVGFSFFFFVISNMRTII